VFNVAAKAGDVQDSLGDISKANYCLLLQSSIEEGHLSQDTHLRDESTIIDH